MLRVPYIVFEATVYRVDFSHLITLYTVLCKSCKTPVLTVSTNNIAYVSLRLHMQNAVPAQPCVGKLGISLVLLNFLHCNFTLWFETP